MAPPTKSSDGEIAILEARAEALSGSVDADHAGTALAWREVGAAYFDFAADVPRAVRAWERAAALNPERGIECLASDLVSFAGPDAALGALRDLAARRPKAKETARVLAVASTVALSAGKLEEAFRVACAGARARSVAHRRAGRRRTRRQRRAAAGARETLPSLVRRRARPVRRARGALSRGAPARKAQRDRARPGARGARLRGRALRGRGLRDHGAARRALGAKRGSGARDRARGAQAPDPRGARRLAASRRAVRRFE